MNHIILNVDVGELSVRATNLVVGQFVQLFAKKAVDIKKNKTGVKSYQGKYQSEIEAGTRSNILNVDVGELSVRATNLVVGQVNEQREKFDAGKLSCEMEKLDFSFKDISNVLNCVTVTKIGQ